MSDPQEAENQPQDSTDSYRSYMKKKKVRVKLRLTDHELKRIQADWCKVYGSSYIEASLPSKQRLLRFEDEMIICD